MVVNKGFRDETYMNQVEIGNGSHLVPIAGW